MVARGRGVSVNSLILTALSTELDRVKGDSDFMSHLKTLIKRDKDILDRLDNQIMFVHRFDVRSGRSNNVAAMLRYPGWHFKGTVYEKSN